MKFFQALTRRLRPGPDVDETRWVVLDVESSGLDPKRDRLLAIAAIAVHTGGRQPRIALGDSFEVVVRQEVQVADKENILLHGIGVGAQRQGMAPDAALTAFQQFIGNAPLIAFHAPFDEMLILRAFDAVLGHRPANPWLDLEPLAAVLHPKVKARSLDEWMAQMDIRCAVRHQAAADTMATAELLQKLWPAALREMGGKVTFSGARHLAAQRRWLT